MAVHRLPRIAKVGTTGKLRIEYARRDSQTIIARSHCTSPWHLFPPIYLDDTGAAYTLLLNPSGGLVGGDRLSIDMTLGPQSHVVVSTPSANRVYRAPSSDSPSVQTIEIDVGPDAILEWIPEHTIPFAGARFRQTLHVRLSPGATLVLWDAMASGRLAQGERWAFASLDNEITIRTASGASLVEHTRLDQRDHSNGVGIVKDWDYVGALYIVSDGMASEVWKTLEIKLAEILEGMPGDLLGGVSLPAVPGLVVKLVARSGPVLTGTLERLWDAARWTLWGFPPLNLRKY